MPSRPPLLGMLAGLAGIAARGRHGRGYDTRHTLCGGKLGMLSVNAATGVVCTTTGGPVTC